MMGFATHRFIPPLNLIAILRVLTLHLLLFASNGIRGVLKNKVNFALYRYKGSHNLFL